MTAAEPLSTTRLFGVEYVETWTPADAPTEAEEGGWATFEEAPSPPAAVTCDVDVKYKRPGSYVFRSHGFFHAMALTEENVLSRLEPGDYVSGVNSASRPPFCPSRPPLDRKSVV